MESFGGSGLPGVSAVTKKPRSATSRRPRPDSLFVEGRGVSPPSSTPSSENASKLSLDENTGYGASSRKKEINLNSSAPRTSSLDKSEGIAASRKSRKDDKKYGNLDEFYGNSNSRGGRYGSTDRTDHGGSRSDLKRCSEGVLAPANWRSVSKLREGSEKQSGSPDDYGGKSSEGRNLSQSVGAPNGSAENKLRKVKLKVGGVIRTIHAKSDDISGSSAKPSRPSDASRHRQKLILQDNSDDEHTPAEKGNGLQGVPWKDFSGGGFPRGANEVSRGQVTEESLYVEQTDKPHRMPSSEAVRKSKRVPKRRVLDGASDDGDEDDEIRYLERLKSSNPVADYIVEHGDGAEDSLKKRKISTLSKSKKTGYDVDEDYGSSRSAKDSRNKPRTGRESEDTDYVEEEEPGSDDGFDANSKKQKKEFVDTLTDARVEPLSLTTRQRALQSGKSAGTGGSLIEFPNGLPPAPPRKQKEKLSEVEQQAKKAEAAQRRRLQVEKQARELEAEAIRKILGQESSRKKREDKERKERDERAQRKAAEALVLAPGTVRWIMGPTGTIVTFAEDVGLPSIFDSKPCSYPPPREKCAGPSCTNVYKYRDSKLNLPLCSLQCYRAVQKNGDTGPIC